MTNQPYPSDSVSPAMVAEHFTGLTRKKNDVILKMAEEIVSLNQELDRLRGHNQHLQQFLDAHGGAEVWELDKAVEQTQQSVDKLKAYHQSLIAETPEVENRYVRLALSLEDFAHPATSYTELKTDLRELRDEMKSLASSGDAVSADENEPLPSAAGKAKQLKKNIARLALRCFNAEAENIIKSVTAKNVQTSADKIGKAADAISRLTKPLDISISYEYQRLKGQELEIAGQKEETGGLLLVSGRGNPAPNLGSSLGDGNHKASRASATSSRLGRSPLSSPSPAST